MTKYQFRTNWLGQIVLQTQDWLPTQFGDKEFYWRDATTQDLKDYWLQQQHQSCKHQTQRELFERECG